VPDVNVVCFARVTHSRRIFVQQLGRGLRLSEGKSKVTVLDFVTDLKRAKAVLDLRRAVSGDTEDLMFPSSHSIVFNDARAESLLTEWLYDVASLESDADEVQLNFPHIGNGRSGDWRKRASFRSDLAKDERPGYEGYSARTRDSPAGARSRPSFFH
jgi:superfamily II DNA or RNA helicase